MYSSMTSVRPVKSTVRKSCDSFSPERWSFRVSTAGGWMIEATCSTGRPALARRRATTDWPITLASTLVARMSLTFVDTYSIRVAAARSSGRMM